MTSGHMTSGECDSAQEGLECNVASAKHHRDCAAPVVVSRLHEAGQGHTGGALDNPTLCLNDACVTAHILRPEIFRSEKRCVEIEINDPVRIGETRVVAGEARTNALLDVDREAFFALVHDALIETH